MKPTLEQLQKIGELRAKHISHVERGFGEEEVVKSLGEAIGLLDELTNDDPIP